MAVWTVAQTGQFLNGIRSHRLYAAVHLIALRGLRRGEAVGLRWYEVDLEEGTAVVCRQLQRRDDEVVVCAPRTPHSNRVVALDRSTVAALRTYRTRQLAEQEAFGDGYRDSGFVFTNRNGDPIAPDWLTHQFQRLIAEQQVPPIRLHDLRHSHATILLLAGVPVHVVSQRLGHASPVVTMAVYAHVLPGSQREAADLFARPIGAA